MKVLSFRLADQLFGVEITKVKEINRNVEYTTVPRAPKTIVGLFNMRGQIVTLFSLAEILGYDACLDHKGATCIILKSTLNNPNQMGFLIDKTGEVIDIDDEICESPPANVDDQKYRFVTRVARLKNELLMVIDPKIVFEI